MVFSLLPKAGSAKNPTDVYEGSTRPRHVFWSAAFLKETGLVFLVKCGICILLVLVALQWRGDHAPNLQKSASRAAAQHEAGGFVQGVIDGAASLVRAGGDALAVAARDKCLAAPRDCLSAAQRVQSAAGRAH
jgi:hypothetical protein